MKANELMIGDWVTFKDCQHENPILIKIIAIGFQADEENDCLVQIDGDKGCDIITIDDEIVGIPLTAEILEKNGFENDFYEEESVADYHTIRLDGYSLRGKVDGWDNFLITSCNGNIDVVTDFHGEFRGELQFVHELQRALRCCKLNELANNFKI